MNCYSPTEDVLGNAPVVGAGGACSVQELLKGTGTKQLNVRRKVLRWAILCLWLFRLFASH